MDSRITASLPETSQSTAKMAANPIMSSSDSLSYMYLLLRRAGNLSSKHIYIWGFFTLDVNALYISTTKDFFCYQMSAMSSTSLRLQDKIAIVTGASSGIGRAISLRYAREGAKVVCADISDTARSQVPEEEEIATHDLITKEGGHAIFVQTDVGDAGQVESLVKTAVDKFGRIDM